MNAVARGSFLAHLTARLSSLRQQLWDDRAFDHSEVGGPRYGGHRDMRVAKAITNRKECAMKLTSAQVERTLGQIEARAIPDDHPVVSELNDLFGEHTFFLDSNGLNIVEPVELAQTGVDFAKIVNSRTGTPTSVWSHTSPSQPMSLWCSASDTEPDQELTTGQARPRRIAECLRRAGGASFG